MGDPVDKEKSSHHYYNKSNTKIQFSPLGNWFEVENTTMEADIESFEVFGPILGRDKNYIFITAHAVTNIDIDLPSFRVKNEDHMENIGFDKDYIYFFKKVYENENYKGTGKIIKGANPKTFIRTDYDWANDGKYHFFKSTKVEADFDSFKVLNEYFAKDKHLIFLSPRISLNL